jgi:peptidyl-dipeptidase Dcp
MKNFIYGLLISCLLLAACNNNPGNSQKDNPFFTEYQTPFHVPPFDKIKLSHFKPACIEGINQEQDEIAKICLNRETPNFENTVLAIEESGKLFTKVNYVMFNLLGSNNSDSLQNIARELMPKISKLQDDINLNVDLFKRVKYVYSRKDSLKLNIDQLALVEKTYKRFVRGGSNLEASRQEEFRKINQELSLLTLKFSNNLLAETNNFRLVLDKEDDFAGLPEGVKNAALQAGKEAGMNGKAIITLQAPSWIPFLQYSSTRDLREKVFTAYIERANHNDSLDNKNILIHIAELRFKRAQILGYKTHADYILEECMAKNPSNVYKLLSEIMIPALKVGKKEALDLQELINKEGGKFKLQAWDWWYYTEKLRKEKYNLDEQMLRPYFKLDNVREGAFLVANKLYGLNFIQRNDLPVYHKEVQLFEVKEADGKTLGLLYMDFFPRPSKEGGAWCGDFLSEHIENGKKIAPIVTTVFNFTKPSGDKPALLNFEEVSTLFHEFGHALNSLFSECPYVTLGSVPNDYAELPSQIMENWASEPEVMKLYAKHYQTGEIIPQELIDKIKKSGQFNQGFITLEYLAASFLDMDWHTISDSENLDVSAFETRSIQKIKLIPEIVPRYRSTYFNHIFGGGYSAGYYSYIWSAILDADAFEAFKEKGLFDQATARSFRVNILSKGGTEDPMKQYVRFRGKEPSSVPLLKRRGLK